MTKTLIDEYTTVGDELDISFKDLPKEYDMFEIKPNINHPLNKLGQCFKKGITFKLYGIKN